jgi:hypothetical protein
MTVTLILVTASLVFAFPAMSAEVHDASGITRVGDDLLIVGDKDPGRFSRLLIVNHSGRAIVIDPEQAVPVAFPTAAWRLT